VCYVRHSLDSAGTLCFAVIGLRNTPQAREPNSTHPTVNNAGWQYHPTSQDTLHVELQLSLTLVHRYHNWLATQRIPRGTSRNGHSSGWKSLLCLFEPQSQLRIATWVYASTKNVRGRLTLERDRLPVAKGQKHIRGNASSREPDDSNVSTSPPPSVEERSSWRKSPRKSI
jgi:hypothetical protein